MDVKTVVKNSQEQAVAAWIDYLNQLRISEFMQKMAQQDCNFENAIRELEELKYSIGELIQTNRGGIKGMHGFIAERMQVYIENARRLVEGADREYNLIDDNGPVDYLKNGISYQLKFVQKHLSLDAVAEHMEKYPDYLKNGGKYHIPKDFYDKIINLYNLPKEEAKKLANTDYKFWQYIQKFFKEKDICIDDIEPAVNRYKEVQSGWADSTVEREKRNIKKQDQRERNALYQNSKPSFEEGIKIAGVSAAMEGGVTFCLNVYKKCRDGKRLSEFSADDWKEVGIDTAKGTGQGGIRGATVYTMTNFTVTPAAVASALVTAAFGVVVQANKLKKGEIDQESFIINSEILSLDVTVSALSSVLGEVVIPIPILGAIIGQVTGMFLYNIAKESLSEKEQELISRHNQEVEELNQYLDERYTLILKKFTAEIQKYDSLIEMAFSENVNQAFIGSVRLAEYLEVPKDKILRNKRDIENYFLS